MEDIEIGQPKQLTDRQMSSLVSLWRLSHHRQAPLSSWTMLYTQRRPKRKSPMIWLVNPFTAFSSASYLTVCFLSMRWSNEKKPKVNCIYPWKKINYQMDFSNPHRLFIILPTDIALTQRCTSYSGSNRQRT